MFLTVFICHIFHTFSTICSFPYLERITFSITFSVFDRKYEIKIKVSFYSLYMNIKKLYQEKKKYRSGTHKKEPYNCILLFLLRLFY